MRTLGSKIVHIKVLVYGSNRNNFWVGCRVSWKRSLTIITRRGDKRNPFNVEAMILNAQANTENEQVKASSARVFTRPKLKAPAWGLASAATVLLAVGFWMNLTPTTAEINTKLLSGLEKSPSGTVININSELKIELMASYQNQQGVVCRSMLEHSPQSSNPAMACFVKDNGN